MGDAIATMLRGEGQLVDVDRMRAWRRRRLFDAMAADGLDALVLGRPANAMYASGANQLWTSGARPFGPAAVAVAATGRVHLLNTWDEGVPAEIGHSDLFGLSWNPATLLGALREIPELAAARRVGTDSTSPGFDGFLGAIAPNAEMVDATGTMRAARAVKSADELACIATATALAESGLAAMVEALRPGVSERELLGAYLERIASLGAPTPPTEGVACVTERTGPVTLRRLASTRAAGLGELVVLDAGARFLGYEGGVGRTWVVGPAGDAHRSLAARGAAGRAALLGACRPGASGRDVRRAWESTGEPTPAIPVLYGLGLGMEPPVVAPGVGDDDVLAEGAVLALTSWVTEAGVGGFLSRDVVIVREEGPELVSRYGDGPAGGGAA